MTAHPRIRGSLGLLVLSCLLAVPGTASTAPHNLGDSPILVIGASYASGKLPFNDDLVAPFGGGAVGFGSYLSLGDALIKKGAFVINEAQAGATSFDRPFCVTDACLPGGWQGYSTQLQKAAARVAVPNPLDPAQIVGLNAAYVYIGLPNDCLHSGAAGIPQQDSAPCTPDEVSAYVDRMVAVGHQAQAMGLVPLYPLYPDYAALDLDLAMAMTGLSWVASEAQYCDMADTYEARISAEVPGALVVDVWKNFENLGDGLHPTPKRARRAAARVLNAIEQSES